VPLHVGSHLRPQRLVFGRCDEQAGGLDLLDGQSGESARAGTGHEPTPCRPPSSPFSCDTNSLFG
jgi:hypothetical protein